MTVVRGTGAGYVSRRMGVGGRRKRRSRPAPVRRGLPVRRHPEGEHLIMSDTFTAFTAEKTDRGFRRGVTDVSLAELPHDGVLVDVEWSSVNYKDSLAATEKGRVARISPLIVGIDLAGTVRESGDGFDAGDPVIAHGYDLGVARHGGYAQVARVPADW